MTTDSTATQSSLTAPGIRPTREEILGQNRIENLDLFQRLSLQSPADLEKVPPTLAFDRVREVALPWPEIMDAMSALAGGNAGPTRALRAYFETSWWNETRSNPSKDDLAALFENDHIIVLPETLPEGEVSTRTFHRHIREKVKEDKKPDKWVDKAIPVTEGVILRDAISGRYYLIATFEPVTGPELLKTPKGYAAFWEENADAAMVIAENAEAALTSQTSYDELDLRAIYIERRFRELKVFQEVANAINDKVKGALDGLLELGLGRDLDFSAFQEVQERYVNARLAPERIIRELRHLKRQAEDMKYILFLGDEPDMELEFPDGTKTTAKAGELYSTYSRQCHWTVYYPKAIVGSFFEEAWFGIKRVFGGAKDRPTKDWPDPQSDWFDDYKKVDTFTDPLAERVRKYRGKQKQTFVFEETPAGYVTADGMALTTIMARCRYDESFRQRCVVMLPVYEQGFSIVKPVVAYHVFERPLPGIIPMKMPRLFVDESLSYRTAWKGAELGELVSAINLTPGEEREMTITRSITRETSSTRSTSSVIELASSESTDLSTEMERIAKVDNEFTAHGEGEITTGSTSTDKNGMRDVIGGLTSLLSTVTTGTSSSKYTFGATDTLKLFSQTMNRVAKKAATSVSRNNRQEISTTSSEITTVSTMDSTVIKLSNINKGRTLNLMFYRVYNRYTAGLFIDDLRFGVTEGTELIAGSGIYNTRSFRPNQIARMLDVLENAPLPFDFTGDGERYFQDKVLDTLLETLDAEYLESDQQKSGPLKGAVLPGTDGEAESNGDHGEDGETANVLLAPASLLAKLSDARNRPRASKVSAPSAEALRQRITELEDDFGDIRLKSRALGGDRGGASDLLVAAQGLYLDSMLGARPATEPYSEEMRAQEIRKSAAEVLRAEADAEYTRAQASRIAAAAHGGGGNADGGGNILTGVHLLKDPRVLTLGFLLPLAPGDWVICDNGDPVTGGEIPPDQFHRTTIVIKPPRTTGRRGTAWLNAPDLMSRITVRNRQTEEEIGPA